MDINAKHYENLNIEPWDIMKADFTKEQWIGFLKGNIIKYTLREKGENYKDAQKIQKYAEELAKAYQEEHGLLEQVILEELRNAVKDIPVEKLEVGKWYNSRNFNKDELAKLLPAGTYVEVLRDSALDCQWTAPSTGEETVVAILDCVAGAHTHLRLKHINTLKFWFKIID